MSEDFHQQPRLLRVAAWSGMARAAAAAGRDDSGSELCRGAVAGFYNNLTGGPSSGAARADIVSWSSIRSERASIDCPALIFPGTEEVRTSYGAVGYRRDTSLPEWVDGLLIVGLCWHSNRYRGTEVSLRRLNYPRES